MNWRDIFYRKNEIRPWFRKLLDWVEPIEPEEEFVPYEEPVVYHIPCADNICQYANADIEIVRWFDVFFTAEYKRYIKTRHAMRQAKNYSGSDLVKSCLLADRVNDIKDTKDELVINISHPYYPHDITFRIPIQEGELMWEWLYVLRVDTSYGMLHETIDNLISCHIEKEVRRRFAEGGDWQSLRADRDLIARGYATRREWEHMWKWGYKTS